MIYALYPLLLNLDGGRKLKFRNHHVNEPFLLRSPPKAEVPPSSATRLLPDVLLWGGFLPTSRVVEEAAAATGLRTLLFGDTACLGLLNRRGGREFLPR